MALQSLYKNHEQLVVIFNNPIGSLIGFNVVSHICFPVFPLEGSQIVYVHVLVFLSK